LDEIVEEFGLKILVVVVVMEAESDLYGILVCLSSTTNVK
jgi:hypothetical protein